MNLFNNVKCRWDANGEIWFDIKAHEISLIQKAALMGGHIAVYHLPQLDFYSMCYHYKSGKLNFQIYGCEITKDQYESQLIAWKGNNYIKVSQGTELTMIDNLYFAEPNV